MKFKVEILETLSKVVEIQAETTDEAIMTAEQQYHDEYWILDSENFQGVTFNARKAED